VKKKQIVICLSAVMVLASQAVIADQKYPASDFKPEVVYQDKEYIEKNSPSSDQTAPVAEAGSKYPAASFEPKVIFNDSSYKHFEPSPSTQEAVSSPEMASAPESSDSQPTGAATAVDGDRNRDEVSMVVPIVGLLALIGGGLLLFGGKLRKCAKKATAKKTTDAAVTGGLDNRLTGVSRYLNKMSGTGVSRYIERRIKTPLVVTGVARYVARQASASKQLTTRASVTGVEKYMRDRGETNG